MKEVIGARNGLAVGQRPRFSDSASLPDHRDYRRGQVVFDGRRPDQQPYRVLAGEVVIVRNGSAVDIVEPGEYLDPSIWNRATAIAWTDCRLVGA